MFATWRLLAALLVMLYHFCQYGPPAYAKFAVDLELLTPLLDMFFMVSGFLISVHYADRMKSIADYKIFLIRRLARLYPLHILTLSFFCMVWLAVSAGVVSSRMTETYSLVELINELLLINAWGVSDVLTFNFVSWSLSAEWFCYLLFPAILFVWRKWGVFALIALLVIYTQIMDVLSDAGVTPFSTWMHANTWGAYRVFADFLIGAIVADLASRRLLKIRSHALAWGVFAAAVGYMLTNPSWEYGPILAISFAIYIAAQVEFNAPSTSPFYKPFMPFAAASFGIYLWHPVLASIVIGVAWNRILKPMEIGSFYMAIIAAMILTVLVAVLSARFFEAPVRKTILSFVEKREIKKKKRKAAPVPAE
ncbi:acyltransferase family protein [Cohaesibacter celericrescens]|nr:acyltransferase [Cohaesibacter celericrescens]